MHSRQIQFHRACPPVENSFINSLIKLTYFSFITIRTQQTR
ncbi:hypothetical protein HMPREF1581_01468 [Gardnerella vaginalis JCP8108]|uniref:Uncharacterized protein n=1 Tax=Gardnerella vaginalis JCP8108 TaxID=1261066 RepID=S4GTG6_GARVA|nr:hypothetical protein HMPREF1581_01468 [Gardnerella vaginalis JCP8108]